jgi:N-acetylmuramoyl-L-alanine amidase
VAPPPALPAGDGGVAVVATGGAGVAATAGGLPFVRAHEGLLFPVIGRDGRWLLVQTQCENTAWIDGAEVSFTPTPEATEAGSDLDMEDAIVVLDPGHGGPNTGAIGPAGTVEKDLNLDIARRARDLLTTPHDVNWETGEIFAGDTIGPAGTVWLTRTEGPAGADIETGLIFRATLGNVAGANALVSIHNNASPDGPAATTGAEAYYRVQDIQSKRLAGLIVEELRRSFARFDVQWAGALDAGAKYRVRSDGETDLYGVLKNATVPAVLVEGAYLSNEPEEALLGTPEFRQAYADALYRSLVRFLTTDDPGSGFVEPINRTASPGSGSPQPSCTIPAQP